MVADAQVTLRLCVTAIAQCLISVAVSMELPALAPRLMRQMAIVSRRAIRIAPLVFTGTIAKVLLSTR